MRGTKFFDGVGAACLPCGTGLAATWDQDLLHQAGILIGKECQAKGAHCWLGPTVCIQRSPLGGRGFESMSEDPYATGKLAAAYINGVQSTGVVAAIKHWLANDQEHERVGMNAIVGLRALREIHMLPFQIAMRDSAPGAVMACYNRVNGTHVSESKELLDGVLREDWGFDGLVVSDWYVPPTSLNQRLNTAYTNIELVGSAHTRLQNRCALASTWRCQAQADCAAPSLSWLYQLEKSPDPSSTLAQETCCNSSNAPAKPKSLQKRASETCLKIAHSTASWPQTASCFSKTMQASCH